MYLHKDIQNSHFQSFIGKIGVFGKWATRNRIGKPLFLKKRKNPVCLEFFRAVSLLYTLTLGISLHKFG